MIPTHIVIISSILCVFVLGQLSTMTFAGEETTCQEYTELLEGNTPMDEHDKIIAAMSEEEKEWYEKFQKGVILLDGWVDISEEILEELPQHERPRVQHKLCRLGKQIGIEWSRPNDIRKINTDHLKGWGKRLKAAKKKGAQHISETINTIVVEVEKLLTVKETLTAETNE